MTDDRTPAAIERAAELEQARQDASIILAHSAKPGTFEHTAQETTRVMLARTERLTAALNRMELIIRGAGLDPEAAQASA